MATVPAELERSESDVASGFLHIPADIHSLDGFRAWVHSDEFPEKLRVFFWRGEVWLDMSKEEIRSHAAVKTAIAGALFNLNQEIDFGDLYINGVRVTNRDADVSNNPDMVAVFWESVEAGSVHYEARENRETEIIGSPDWVLEIVSEGSVVNDTKHLRQAYHDARIREYWLVDARGAEIDFRIWVWKPRGYQAAKPRQEWIASPLFGKSCRLTRKPDRRGAWRYRLDIK